MTKGINTNQAPSAIGPYSQAVQFTNIIFCSGQIALDPVSGDIVGENIIEQTHQVMKNLKNILESANSSLENIVRTEVFLKDINDFAGFNEVYAEYFPYEIKPARFTVEVSNLPRNAKIEIACIAYTNQ